MKWLLVFLLGCARTVTVYRTIDLPPQIIIEDCLPSKAPAEPELYCKGLEFNCPYKDIDTGKKLDYLRELKIWVELTVANCKYPVSRTFSNYLNYSGGTR